MTRLLSRDDISAVLTLDDCIAAVEQVFHDYAMGLLPKSESLGMRVDRGTFHVKAARAEVFAAKVNANFPSNPATHGLPTVQGVIVVMDADRGTPLGILDSTLITTLRTAAATAVAAKYLAHEHAATAALIGCGALAHATASALRVVRPLRRVSLWDVSETASDRCARSLAGSMDLEIVRARSLETALEGAEIVVTCTPATTPFLDAQHARPGLFIAAVGADNPEKSEITPRLMSQTLVVTDLTDQAAAMGDLHHAIAASLLTKDDVHGELGEVICGRIAGRQTDKEIFLFDRARERHRADHDERPSDSHPGHRLLPGRTARALMTSGCARIAARR
jgi:alanine dehydrogenase